jgi:hypothetical protein
VHIPKDSLEAVIQKEKGKKTKTKRKALKLIFRVHVSQDFADSPTCDAFTVLSTPVL